MLGLDVQEQSQLHLLESSLSNTVNHKWPILHVHFIDEPISDWNIKEQGDLTSENQKHLLPQTDIVNVPEFIQEPELTPNTESQDCGGHISSNLAVMLGTVERVGPMDIPNPQKMELQEPAESSAIQDRGDFLEICMLPEELKDNHGLTEPDQAAGMADKSSEAGLHSEENLNRSNLQPERDKSTDVNQSNSSGKLTEMCCLMETEFHNSFEHPPGEHEECTVAMSLDQTSDDLGNGGCNMCLEDQEVPPNHCTAGRNLNMCDIQEEPMLCEEASTLVEPKCTDIGDIISNSLLPTISEWSRTQNGTRPVENGLENSLQKRAQSTDICIRQSLDVTTCTEVQHKKDSLCKPLSTALSNKKVETSLEDVHSNNCSDDDNLISGSGKCVHLTEVATTPPNLNISMAVLSAKSFDTQECTLSSTKENNVHLQSVSADCEEDLSSANKHVYKLNEHGHGSSIHLISGKSADESSCKVTDSNLLEDDKAAVKFKESKTPQEQETKEQLLQLVEYFPPEKVCIGKRSPSSHDGMTEDKHCTISKDNRLLRILHGSQLPAICYTTQMPELHSIVPFLTNTTTFCKIGASPDSVRSTKNYTSPRQQPKIDTFFEVLDSNEIPKFSSTVLSSHSRSSEYLEVNKTTLCLDRLREIQCQASTPECQSVDDLISLKSTQQNALVPYVNSWSFLAQSKMPNLLSPNSTSNMIIQKTKSKKRKLASHLTYDKESGFLYVNARSVPKRLPDRKPVLLMQHSGQLNPIKPLLLKCLGNKFAAPKSLFLGNSVWSLRVERSKQGIPCVDPTVSQTTWVSEAVNIHYLPCSLLTNMRSTEKLECNLKENDLYLQKCKSLAPAPVTSSHVVESTALPADNLASSLTNTEIEHNRTVKHVVPIKPMVTRSRNRMNYKESSEFLHTMKPAPPSTLPKDVAKKIQSIFGEQRPPVKLPEGKSGKLSPPDVAVGTLKRKRICIKPEKTLPTNTKRKPPPLQHGQQLLKDCFRQSTCKMEMEVNKARKSIENCPLKLEPKSLTCTIQVAKRPKISSKLHSQPSSSDWKGCVDTGSHTLHSHPPHSLKPSFKNQPLPRNCMTNDITLRRQPSRRCKNSFMEQLNVPNSNLQPCKLSKAFHAHAFHLPNHRSLPSKHVIPKMTSNSLYAKMIKKNVVNLNKCTAEQALLHKLSAIASRLTAPCKGPATAMPLSNTTKLVPCKGVQLQARKLLNVFSCVNVKMSSQQMGNVGFSSSRDHLLSRCMDLCPVPLTKNCPAIPASKFSLPTLENTTFPVSFHMKIDPGLLSDFIKFNPPDYMFKNAPSPTESAQLSEWTLSFFLSPHFPAKSDGIQLFTPWNPNFRSLGASKSDSRCRGKSERMSGCSMLGLHTVLALSSPGCYRLWTRKRNLGSRIPTVQKLSVTQFAHGLKGVPAPFSWKREISSSLAFSLGRVMSMWSRHGLSAFFSGFDTPHPPCSSWQPTQRLSLSVPVLEPSTSLIPKNCLQANETRLPFNTSSWQEKYFGPSHCISGLATHASCLLLEEGGGLGPSYNLSPKQVKDVSPIHCLPFQQQTNLFCLSTEQTMGFEPPVSLSTEQNNDLVPLHCLSIEQEHVCKPPNSLISQQTHNSIPLFSTGKEIGPLSVQQEDALKSTHYLPLNYVSGCAPPCHLLSEQSNGLGPRSSLSADQGDGFERLYNMSIEYGSGLGPLCNLSNKQYSGIKTFHNSVDCQNVPPFTQFVDFKKGMDGGLSEVSPNDQVDCQKTSFCLLPQKTDTVGADLSLSSQKQCEVGPSSVSILQDKFEPPCILTPFKTEGHLFEKTVPHAKAENQSQDNEKEESERKPQRVSQIRIRKTIPKPDPNLTPMGLPKPKRINKKEFSLEDIYTNKNYKCPPPVRSLETIFEEPKEKNGVLVSVSQTKRKRILEFRDCTMPRPKRAKGRVRVMTTCKRGRKAAMEGVQLDALLIQKLMDLENFLLEQEALERGSAAAEKPS